MRDQDADQAETRPRPEDRVPRESGGWEGRGWIEDDFDQMTGEYKEIVDGFYRKRGIDPEAAGPDRPAEP